MGKINLPNVLVQENGLDRIEYNVTTRIVSVYRNRMLCIQVHGCSLGDFYNHQDDFYRAAEIASKD